MRYKEYDIYFNKFTDLWEIYLGELKIASKSTIYDAEAYISKLHKETENKQ